MELREIQENTLPVMKKLHNYCVQHGLRYSISFGTLLGAVRHKGFIPWDDDIDIVMPREDYTRLLTLGLDQPIASDVGLLHYSLDTNYRYPFLRVYDKNTRITVPHTRVYPKETGLWVDVIPMDDYDLSLRFLPRRTLLRLAAWLQSGDLYAQPNTKGAKEMVKRLTHRLFPCPNNEFARFIDRLATGFPADKTRYLYDAIERCASHTLMEKGLFDDLILLDFEDAQFFAPRNYEAMLLAEFGSSWSTPPPEAERIPIHQVEVSYTTTCDRGSVTEAV